MARRTLTGIVLIAAIIGVAAWLRHERARIGAAASAEGPARVTHAESLRNAPSALPEHEPTASPESDALTETDAFPLPDVLIDPEVVVSKAARMLTVYSEGEPVKRYRMALGHAPEGHKQHEGDNKTPEDVYYVCSKNASSKFHRSLGLSYPNESDAEAGLAAGLISQREYKAIVSAMHKMSQPPWNTKLGGEIMIHGGGAHRGDWTQGCIALDDEDAEELFGALPMGATVTIRP